MRQFRTALGFVVGISILLGSAIAQDQNTSIATASALPADMAQRQGQALLSMPSVQVTYHRGGTVRSIRGETGIRISSAARALRKGESGKEVLTALRDVLLVSGQEELTLVNNTSSFETQRALNFSQSIAGIPVIGGGVGILVESSSGMVLVLNSQFLPDRGLPRTPKLTPDEATEATRKALYTLLGALPESVSFSDARPALAYVGRNDASDTEALVWVVTASYLTAEEGQGTRQEYGDLWINAVTGEYVARQSRISHLNRTVYSAGGAAPSFAGFPTGLTLLFTEGNAAGNDTKAISAYGNFGLVDDAWRASVGPSVVPPVRLVAHYLMPDFQWNSSSVRMPNGQEYIVFGDGDSTSYSAGVVRDAIAHEYGHLVYRARYPFLDDRTTSTESAAAIEFYADFLTGLVDVHENGGAATASSYRIAPVFFDSTKFLRSFQRPKDPNAFQRGFDWYPTARRDFSSRYENSSILGHWFYLLAQGGRNASYGVDPAIPDITVDGRTWGVAQVVLHSALTSGALQGSPTFLDLRAATENAANQLSPNTLFATKAAWDAVGVRYACSAAPGKPSVNVMDQCAGRFRLAWGAVPGATHYYGQMVPQGWPWSLAAPVVDGNVTICHQTIRQNYYFRLSACNGCGCSEFTVPQLLEYLPGQCQ